MPELVYSMSARTVYSMGGQVLMSNVSLTRAGIEFLNTVFKVVK